MTRDTIIPSAGLDAATGTIRRIDRIAARLVRNRLDGLTQGELTILDAKNSWRFGEHTDLRATITVRDSRFWCEVLLGGSLGAAESYIQGLWSCDDLTALCRLFARNLALADELERGWARLTAPATKAFHWLRRNTRTGSARNIHAHYDLGNDFFRLFLDETMSYSCGIFEHPGASMRDASIAKMDRVCRKLDLGPEDHLLEIGTGWGSLAMHAAKEHGCRVTTTTISREQRQLAQQQVRAAGLEDRIEILLTDYRELTGKFDKLVSIEMIEAVGHKFLGTYFGKCGELLKEDGLMLVQGITMADHRYETYRRSVDFIQRYVFPGSCLPSVSAMCSAVACGSDLRPVHLEDITPHYAETLRRWRQSFFDRIEDVKQLGYPDSFARLWEFYLCYCEAGFEERTVGDVQLLLAKPRNRRAPVLPPLGTQ
ncbi:MAG: cyclopropane-fatty-acyl-phospholipid synthase [Acidobacteria bacterium]|nr:cyclopropane-fatty-acyl-phospholipid synthase [Acidobacteriota bacterium]